MKIPLLTTALLLTLLQPLRAADLPQIKTAAELKAAPADYLHSFDVKLAYADPGPDAGPWVLVYCDVTTIGGDPIEDKSTDPHPLGPLRVHVAWDGTKTLEPRQQRSTIQLPSGIYVAAVPLLQKGTCHIEIRGNSNSTPLATKDLTITEVKPFYWHTLAMDFSDHQKQRDAGKPAPAALISAAAIPEYQGIAPAIDTRTIPADLLPDLLKAGLPGTLPMDAAWDTHTRDDLGKADRFPLSLAIEKGNFIIRRHGETMRGEADDTLLARWWVNGKPVVAERTRVKTMRDVLRQVTETKESTVQFGYPEALGNVKTGDRIAMQVLYAPGGFSVMPESLLQMDLIKTTGTHVPLLSNKIEFALTRENISDHAKAMKE